MPKTYAKVIADSISATGHRITTVECQYPRFIHSEVMTHRQFSRNAASSRAIPTRKLVNLVRTDPVVPSHWGVNCPGMIANEELDATTIQTLSDEWRRLARTTADTAERWHEMGLHKQAVNRILEPFLPITVIITATEWDNFFRQRCDRNAQPEIQVLANAIRDAIGASTPQFLSAFQWHSPYVTPDEQSYYFSEELIKISVARCARVSYNNHNGERNIEADIRLFERLLTDGHLSPFEHVARPSNDNIGYANFVGWISYRHLRVGR